MAVSKGRVLGGLLASTGLTLGICGYILVVAVLLRAASEVVPPNSVAALGSALVLLGGVLLWVGSWLIPVELWDASRSPAATGGREPGGESPSEPIGDRREA